MSHLPETHTPQHSNTALETAGVVQSLDEVQEGNFHSDDVTTPNSSTPYDQHAPYYTEAPAAANAELPDSHAVEGTAAWDDALPDVGTDPVDPTDVVVPTAAPPFQFVVGANRFTVKRLSKQPWPMAPEVDGDTLMIRTLSPMIDLDCHRTVAQVQYTSAGGERMTLDAHDPDFIAALEVLNSINEVTFVLEEESNESAFQPPVHHVSRSAAPAKKKIQAKAASVAKQQQKNKQKKQPQMMEVDAEDVTVTMGDNKTLNVMRTSKAVPWNIIIDETSLLVERVGPYKLAQPMKVTKINKVLPHSTTNPFAALRKELTSSTKVVMKFANAVKFLK